MQLVAKNRLSEFRKSFGKWMQWELIMFMRMPKAISESIITRKTDDSHLIDEEFHLHAFLQEKTTLASAAKRIKIIDSGLDPYDAFNIVQHQMIDVAPVSNELY
jgi:acyl-CoA oxidase